MFYMHSMSRGGLALLGKNFRMPAQGGHNIKGHGSFTGQLRQKQLLSDI
jgi:hypothetical protein